jgi:hypothetical protein
MSCCHRDQRVLPLRLARYGDAAVDFEHEGVEVDAALGGDAERVDEQVHQHRLAAPDAAPQIDPRGSASRLLPRIAATSVPWRGRCFQLVLQAVESLGRRTLVGSARSSPLAISAS